MKHAIAIVMVAASLLAAPARAQVSPPAIFVTGEASIAVAPDQALIDGGVTSEAKTAREASEANNAAMRKVLLALKGAGIDEKDFQTSRLSLQPQNAPGRTGPSTIVAFRVSNRVTIRLRDITKLSNVIDVMVGAGVNDIGGIDFLVSQASKLSDDIREKAVADARRKAAIYAKAAGVTLGEPLSMSEEGAPAPAFRGRMATVSGVTAITSVPHGEETLSVSVNVSWAMKPKY